MLFTTVSMAFFAALASAHAHHGQHYHHRRHYNTTSAAGTSAASGESTTLTIFATSISTVTSCAPTITNCPASTGPVVVTDIIALTTTVCPVEQAESASSAALASFSATNIAEGGVTSPSVPLSTGNSGPAPTESASGEESIVLTYTLGAGTSTTVVTTTIRHTSTSTVYATIPGTSEEGPAATGEAGGVTEETSSITGEAAGVTGKEGVVEPELTTTYTGTSTSTRYITVVAAHPSGEALPTGVAGGVVNEGSSCAPVTVTVALSTVTVTETASPTPASEAEGAVSSVPVKAADVPYPTEEAPASTAGGSVAAGTPDVIVSTQTVQPLPVTTGAPYGNGTDSGAITSSKTASIFPSGFISMTKPSVYPSGY